jgi:ribosomal protein S18 acetylase RimI-like enzyme
VSKEVAHAPIELRRLGPEDDDLDEVTAELNSTDWEDFDNPFTSSSLREFLRDDHRIYLTAYVGSEIAGAAHAYVLFHPAGHTVLYIDEVDTVSKHRRKGVATSMMEELLALGRRYGAKEAWLGTEEDNEAAQALYRKLEPSEELLGWTFTYKTQAK